MRSPRRTVNSATGIEVHEDHRKLVAIARVDEAGRVEHGDTVAHASPIAAARSPRTRLGIATATPVGIITPRRPRDRDVDARDEVVARIVSCWRVGSGSSGRDDDGDVHGGSVAEG